MLKVTPLLEKHRELGAHLTAFGGWEMPLRYKSELAEHHAVRQQAGLFDLSHMGEFLVRGPKAAEFLQSVLTNDLAKLTPGRAQYTFLLNPQGGIIDDLILYQLESELFLLVVNAANTTRDREWLRENLPPTGVSLQDISEETVLIALSGPASTDLLGMHTDRTAIEAMPYYSCQKLSVAGMEVLVATTGYTGEWTYELFVRKEYGPQLWAILQAERGSLKASPAGLAARNTLRLEMGYLLCGTDIDESTTPLEAGAGWAVKLEKGDFIGRSALQAQKQEGLRRKLVGLLSESARVLPRNAMPLLNEKGEEIGRITSGSLGPTLQRGIALGYLPPTYQLGDTVYISIRGQLTPLRITRPPFVSETSLTQRLKARL
ncbi:MAG: glycine cleavage system aminomethyltransferase GcvT [Bacteroidia bacterium]|nr:glycine cleavage system aminomethyltransferase GcvT [Bacteroidia bacterium]